MSIKNQAIDAGLSRNPALRLAIGESADLIIPLNKDAKYIKTHKIDNFIKKPCTGLACAICALGSKPREVWLVDCYREDLETGELAGCALFLGRQEFGQLADVLPDTGANARVSVEGVGALDKDGQPVKAASGKAAGQQYCNLKFGLRPDK